MSKYINPFTDIGFKRIFGQEMSKPLLLDFLNLLLEGQEHIEDLTFLDKEQPAMYDDDRSLIYDIYCETDSGKKIIVEMQNKSQPYFKNRSIYYVSEAVARQGERGALWHYDIDAVYLVAFLNFCPMDLDKKFRTDVQLTDIDAKTVFSDKIRMTYLQLPLFRKEADECKNDFERWIYLLKNMETLTRLPWAAQSAVFRKLEEIAEVASLSREDRLKYDEGLRKYRDTISVLEGARIDGLTQGRAEGRVEGIAEGRAEGIAEGRAEGIIEGRAEGIIEGRAEGEAISKKVMAKAMIAKGMSIDLISEITGLTVTDIIPENE